jgi:hypothetical protein
MLPSSQNDPREKGMQTTWSSEGIHTDGNVCVDVKAGPNGVVLGQIHGENDTFASDLRLTPEHAEAIGYALLDGARHARGEA